MSQVGFPSGTSRDKPGRDVPLSRCPGTKKFPYPVVPLSRDKKVLPVPLSRKVALSLPVGNPTTHPARNITLLHRHSSQSSGQPLTYNGHASVCKLIFESAGDENPYQKDEYDELFGNERYYFHHKYWEYNCPKEYKRLLDFANSKGFKSVCKVYWKNGIFSDECSPPRKKRKLYENVLPIEHRMKDPPSLDSPEAWYFSSPNSKINKCYF